MTSNPSQQPKGNEGAASPSPATDASSPAPRAVSLWQAAAARWLERLIVIPAIGNNPPKVILRTAELVSPQTDGVGVGPNDIQTDPEPPGIEMLRLSWEPGVRVFQTIALALADATIELAATFESADIDSTPLLELSRSLRKRPRMPTALQVEHVRGIDLQAERLIIVLQTRHAKAENDRARDAAVAMADRVCIDLGVVAKCLLLAHAPTDHADVFDKFFAGEHPLVDRLDELARHREALNTRFRGSRVDPISGSKWTAQSWHGVLAAWADHLGPWARSRSGPLLRLLLGEQADMNTSLAGSTAMAALQEARSARLKSPLDRRYAETTAELEQFTKAMSEALDGLDAEQARLLEGLRMENHGATQVTANTTAPVRPSPHEHAQPEAGGESLAEQVAKKVIEKMPTPPSATTPCLPAAPVLVPRQLPAMVLVTLLERGPMEKRQMRRLPGVRESDRSRVANLLTPRGDLAERGLVRVDRATVALTERGRTEAVMQKERGTTSLDTGQTRDKSRPTHDGSP